MRISRRVLFSTLAAGLLGLFLLQTAPAGKGGGKGGGGEEPPSDPPPVTYEIRFVEDFRLLTNPDSKPVNQHGDLLGSFESTEPFPYAIIYNGDFYPIELFFLDLDESVRYTMGLSDRSEDGSIHICGTCDTADGIRGWVMRLTPDIDGVLVRADFSIAQPVPGDDITSLRNVNSNGEAVGYSRLSTLDFNEKIAICHTSTGATVPFAFDSSAYHFISNSGRWTGSLFEADGSTAVYTWTPADGLQFLANVDDLRDVNNHGDFVGGQNTAETVRNKTIYHSLNYYYDGTLKLLNDNGPTVFALNDYGDLMSIERIAGKGNEPDSYSNLMYFADLDREVPIEDMIDIDNTATNLARWVGADRKDYLAVTNDGVIVGNVWGPDADSGTFLLIPVQP